MPSAKPTVTTPAEPEAGWATSNPTQQAVQDTEPRAAVLVREGWSEPGAEKSSSLLQTGTRGLQDRQERLSDDCCNNLRAFPQQAGEVSRSPGGKRGTCDDAPQEAQQQGPRGLLGVVEPHRETSASVSIPTVSLAAEHGDDAEATKAALEHDSTNHGRGKEEQGPVLSRPVAPDQSLASPSGLSSKGGQEKKGSARCGGRGDGPKSEGPEGGERRQEAKAKATGSSTSSAGEASSVRVSDAGSGRRQDPVSNRDPLDKPGFEELKRTIERALEEEGFLEALNSRLRAGELEMARDDHSRLGQFGGREEDVGQQEKGTGGEDLSYEHELDDFGASGRGDRGESFVASEEEGGGAADSPDSVDVEDSCGAAVDPFSGEAMPLSTPPSGSAPTSHGSLSQVVLKFTTVADGNEAPSFSVCRKGAAIGRGTHNDISIPSDVCMAESDHASILWRDGAFHVQDRGHPYGASIRIGTGRGLRDWPLVRGSMFSAGNSVFLAKDIDEVRGMLLEIVEGPLKGETRRVLRDGATLGRATENTISIADRELSRYHSTVECDCRRRTRAGSSGDFVSGGGIAVGAGGDEGQVHGEGDGDGGLEFYLCDVGSTNGTYVQLVGPYASSRRLELSDHILVGRTGFSVNRFDWGVWEDRGARRTMEDKSVVIQDMGVEPFTSLGLGPQTFVAVYDGHGGAEASAFLWRRLHLAVAEALEEAAPRVADALREDKAAERESLFGSGGGPEAKRCEDRNLEDGVECRSDHHHLDGGGSGVGAYEEGGWGWKPPAPFVSGGGGGSRGVGVPPLPPAAPAAPPSSRVAPVGGGSMTSCSPQESAGARIEATGQQAVTSMFKKGLLTLSEEEEEDSKEVSGPRGERSRSSGEIEVSANNGAAPLPSALCATRSLTRGGGNGGGRSTSCSTAPRLPLEWILGAKAMMSSSRAGGGKNCDADGDGGRRGDASFAAADASGSSSACALERTRAAPPQPENENPPHVGVAAAGPEGGFPDEPCTAGGVVRANRGFREEREPPQQQAAAVQAVGGGEEASSVCVETDAAAGAVGDLNSGGDGGEGSGKHQSGREGYVGESAEDGGGGAGLDRGVAWPGRDGAQSPGGGPSRPLATAGLPAEGGGYGLRRNSAAGLKERRGLGAAVDRVIDEVVSQAFLATDEEFLTSSSKPTSGTTATTVLILGDRFYSFNVGDSRTVLCRSGRAELVSKDHKPNREDETERIKRAGGMVIHRRVMGELAVSRAFGDRAFKMGIKAILREGSEELARDQGCVEEDLQDSCQDADENEKEGAPPEAPDAAAPMAAGSPWAGIDDASQGGEDPSIADRSQLTMRRDSGRSLLRPPADAAPPAPSPSTLAPLLPPPPPAAAPSPPVTAQTPAPVTDPEEALIVACPEMISCRITPEDEFVLLACDGLFDVFSSDEVVQIVRREMCEHGDTQRVCETLTRKAIDERYSRDNVSVVLVVLKKFW